MPNELRPCPFCGSEAIIKTNTGNIETASWFWGECKNDECEYINISPCKTQEQAETDWNTRPVEEALQARIAELEKQVEWHLFDIDNVDTYPPCTDMYLTLSIPERTEYREIDDGETYDVLWFELYSEEYWHKHNVTHWAYLPAPPKEEE